MLEENTLIQDDNEPYGFLIILTAKLGQENLLWNQFVWQLCVLFRKLSQMTRPFTYPIPRWDDAMDDLGHNF